MVVIFFSFCSGSIRFILYFQRGYVVFFLLEHYFGSDRYGGLSDIPSASQGYMDMEILSLIVCIFEASKITCIFLYFCRCPPPNRSLQRPFRGIYVEIKVNSGVDLGIFRSLLFKILSFFCSISLILHALSFVIVSFLLNLRCFSSIFFCDFHLGFLVTRQAFFLFACLLI